MMHADQGMTEREKNVASRYMCEFGIGMAVFAVLFLLLPTWWSTEPGSWAHLVSTLLPILPVAWAMVAIWRHLRNVDEMQRAVLVRSFAFGFAVAMLTAVVIGLLHGGGFEVSGGEWLIFFAGMTGWGVAIPVNTIKSDR